MIRPFELVLFAQDPATAREAARAGMDAFIVDWERNGKDSRQRGADTQINRQGPAELRRIRRLVSARLLCRVNPPTPSLGEELEQALAGGADEILVPMVRDPRELEPLLARLQGRCGLGILVETKEAVLRARDLASLPLARVFVGLNDLSIERGHAPLFEPLVDGTMSSLADAFRDHHFGFGGLTRPDMGTPLPCRLFMGEMFRLGATFSFLRRAFYRDFPPLGMARTLLQIRQGLEACASRTDDAIAADRAELICRVRSLGGGGP